MRKIVVGTDPLGPCFGTPEEAIKHADSYGPLTRAKLDEQLLQGSQIIDAYWTDTDFVIRFSNATFLHIYVKPDLPRKNFDWRIVTDSPVLDVSAISGIGAPAVELDFQEAGKYVMDRSRMMAVRRGNDLRQFHVNEDFFYLYTPRQLILSFGCVFRKDSRANLLYVYEGD